MGNTDIKRRFGMAVNKRRKQLGITQTELAHQACLHRTYICDVELGHRNVSLQSIEKIARGLRVSIHMLFLELNSEPKDAVNFTRGETVSSDLDRKQ